VSDVPIRDAATVVLLRDAPGDAEAAPAAGSLEVWLLTRVAQMVFAAGMTVFPGGRVDPSDADVPVSDEDAVADLARRFGCEPHAARALLGAAVRETFEETGVLLSTPPADLADHRADVESARTSFAQLLRDHGLSVDPTALRPWSRWVTPAGETRRYDTRFFVGALPAGARAADLTTESSAAEWVPIAVALEQARRGERKMLPPTLATLASLLPFRTVTEALAAADGRVIEAVRPTIRLVDGEVIAELPDGTSLRLPKAMLP
jgi:8-oxo-dGTP pyrophosphatase MutT (NUDIX family)